MAFSIWEYLRERTRDAVLAGFQDALDIAEQGDTEGSQHAAANRLRQRLAVGSLPHEPDQAEAPSAVGTKSLPHPSMNGQHAANGNGAASSIVPETAPSRPADASTFDHELESRLNSDASQDDQGPPPPTLQPGRARRGRPPKNR